MVNVVIETARKAFNNAIARTAYDQGGGLRDRDRTSDGIIPGLRDK
jgi:hypothetical protein